MDNIKVIIENCGAVGYALMAAMVVAIWIFLERFFCFHKNREQVESFLHGLYNSLRTRKVLEAVSMCDSKNTPVSHVVRAVITSYDKGESALRQATDDAANLSISRLEHGMKLLGAIGNIAPILGLIGTLTSLMAVFEQVSETGNFTPMAELIGPVMNAMFTTVLGLIVAVAVHCFYYLLTESMNSIISDMEKAASEMTFFMAELRGGDEPASANGAEARNGQEGKHGKVEK